MRVVVTGNLGYIGTVLTPLLSARGHEVVGIDSGLFNKSVLGRHQDIPTTVLDIRDVHRGDPRFEGADVVIHLAGLANDPLGDLDPTCTDDINHTGAVRVAEVAKDAGVRMFVFSSTCSVYGASDDALLTETSPLRPVTPYGKSKVDAEISLALLADDTFSPVFFRSGTIYGNSPRIRFDLVVNNLVAWASATGEVRLKSTGTSWRPMVHVGDVAEAMVAAAEANPEDLHNQIINLSNPNGNHRVCDIAEVVVDTVPGSVLSFADGAAADVRNYRVDVTKLSQLLPHAVPSRTIHQGAAEVYAACVANGLTIEDFEGSRYARVAHLKDRRGRGEIDAQYRPQVTSA